MKPCPIKPSLKKLLCLFRPKKQLAFSLPVPSRLEAVDIEKAYVRTFTSDDGRKVLAHLNGLTFMRAAAMDAPNETLRYMEGQRSLLATITRMIERGQSRK